MPDIFVVGLGITSVAQMTQEAKWAIQRSEEVFFLDTGVATQEYLQQLCPKVTSLYAGNYQEQHARLTAYHRMAADVIEAAMDHPPVAFAVHGHPFIAVTAPLTVLKAARVLGLEVESQPGVSAVDTIFADLAFDPIVQGIQMYEATDVLLRRRPLQADVPALLWQIGSLESTLHTQKRSLPNRFHRFVQYLLQFYHPDHEVTAVYSAPHPLMVATKISCRLIDLPQHAAELHAGFTLFVPAAQQRPIVDVDLLNRLSDPDHLASMTR